mmetsp:Transcript_1726/g.5696  ORF Transcript_1726/g.5696 Transcript_1726/m.5696 type:complete len:333 (-) Transcript_1726:495-1493(-)
MLLNAGGAESGRRAVSAPPTVVASDSPVPFAPALPLQNKCPLARGGAPRRAAVWVEELRVVPAAALGAGVRPAVGTPSLEAAARRRRLGVVELQQLQPHVHRVRMPSRVAHRDARQRRHVPTGFALLWSQAEGAKRLQPAPRLQSGAHPPVCRLVRGELALLEHGEERDHEAVLGLAPLVEGELAILHHHRVEGLRLLGSLVREDVDRKERRLVRLGQAPAGVARPLAAERPAVDAITVLIAQLFEAVARDASELRRSKPLPDQAHAGANVHRARGQLMETCGRARCGGQRRRARSGAGAANRSQSGCRAPQSRGGAARHSPPARAARRRRG